MTDTKTKSAKILYFPVPNTKEVVVDIVENTTTTVRKMVRFDEDVDFENPSEDLQKLLADKFLKRERPSVERTMKILHDADLDDYRYKERNRYPSGIESVPVNDELVYMDLDYSGISKPKLARWSHLGEYSIQSVLLFGRIQETESGSYFSEYNIDEFTMFFPEKKEDLVSLWENKKIKSLLDSQVFFKETRYQLTKVFDFFEKGIPTKSMKDEYCLNGGSGTYIAVLVDLVDYRKVNFTPRNTILLGERDYASEEVA